MEPVVSLPRTSGGARKPPRRLLPLVSLTILALAAAAAPTSASAGDKVRVIGIVDGDTLEVLRNGRAVRVRLEGIDCPERDQAYANRARMFSSDLAFGKTVVLAEKGLDQYGRTLGEVTLPDGRSLNQELVRAGLAWWYRTYSKDRSLGALEEEARKARRGLWADSRPVPPWEFRKKRPAPALSPGPRGKDRRRR